MTHSRRGCRPFVVIWLVSLLTVFVSESAAAGPIDIGMRRELFVDKHLIERLDGTRLVLQTPQDRGIVLKFDEPWEMPFAGALSIFKDGAIYRMYYRGAGVDGKGEYDPRTELTCYAESRDGVEWQKPKLRLVEYHGSKENNIILHAGRESHNFMAIKDERPGVPAAERYKAVGGTRQQGLWRYVSNDGIHWRRFEGQPLFAGYALDTLNVLVWSPAEKCYALYIRTWSAGGTPEMPKFAGFRTVSRSTSRDFIHWSKPEQMTFGDTPMEHLYTNGTTPYFRAPHILMALPFRFLPDRQVLSSEELRRLGVHPKLWRGISDAVFMTSRGGLQYDRTFLESFIRPGSRTGAWTSRSNIPGVGIVETGPLEVSLFTTTHHTMPDYHVRRYTLRTDGFVAVNAPFAGGELVTKPFRFAGRYLAVNYATSSAGEIRVEVQDENGRALSGLSLADAVALIGDAVEGRVRWKGQQDLSRIAGQTIRLRFVMKDSDLFAFQFHE